MNSNSDSERQSCGGPNVRLIGVVYNDMSKGSVKSCRKMSKDGSGLWRIVEEANSLLKLLYHR